MFEGEVLCLREPVSVLAHRGALIHIGLLAVRQVYCRVVLCLGEPVSVCQPTGERYVISDSVQVYYGVVLCLGEPVSVCQPTGERYVISDSAQCDRYIY